MGIGSYFNFNRINDLIGKASEFSNNIGALLGKTKNDDGTNFTPSFSGTGQTDSLFRRLALSYAPTQTQQGNGKTQAPPKIVGNKTDLSQSTPPRGNEYEPKAVILPLKTGSKKASYEELSRRATIATLEANGIRPTNMEIEALMDLPASKNMDMNGWLDKDWNFHDKPGLMPEAGNHKDANGNTVYGYKFTLSPKFQKSVIDDYKTLKGELAANPNQKAVIDMTLNERMAESIKIAYNKGYISKEIAAELQKLSPEQLAVAFGIGGAVGLAAKTGAKSVLGVLGGALMFKEGLEQYAEFEGFALGCAKATSRAELDKPAQDFGKWMGKLSKEGVMAVTAWAGAKIAPAIMPAATAKAEQVITSTVNGMKEAMSRTGSIGEPVLATPNGGWRPLSDLPNPKSPIGGNKGDGIFEARMKPEEVLLPGELQKLKDVAGYRETEGLPEYKYKQKTGTVAETEVQGNKSQGVNTKMERERLGIDSTEMRKATLEQLQKIGKLEGVKYSDDAANFLTHAEAQALMKAAEKTGGKLPEKMTLTVDRTTCDRCQIGLPNLLELYGVKELTIINASGRRWLVTPSETIEITRQK